MKNLTHDNGKTCAIIGLIVNTLLVILKFLSGIVAKSQAMIADSLHSLSDEIATISVLLSIQYSQKPPDKEHPYGHGNVEVLVAIFVSILILLTGIFLGYSAIHSILHKHFYLPGKTAIYAAIVSIIVKEILYKYTINVGRKLNSPAIIANAYDHRSDAFSSIGALISILAARMGMLYLDPIGGMIISLFILKMGVNIIKENIKIIMDATPNKIMQTEIDTIVSNTKGVLNSSPAKIHSVGRNYFVEITISVDKNITVQEGHKIAELIKDTLIAYKPEIKDVIVHIEPY